MSILNKCLMFGFNNTNIYIRIESSINSDIIYIYLYISYLFFFILNKLQIPIIF